ncbi:hypothetical protein [Streptomyces sp. NPDC059442]|uniref:hypothetical protein n=1 Tax=unclassified Streptomyces TaxID=2593676 RepID=UPI0036C632EB
MADRHLHLTGTTAGRFLTRRLGLPRPAEPRRRPASGAVNGQVVRVCGQSPLGA